MWRHDVHGQTVEPVELPQELERVLRDYEQAWQSGNAEALADQFTVDGLVRRDGRWIRGRDSIRVAYENAGGPLRLRAVSYAVDDSVGYVVGQYGYGAGGDVSYRGTFVLALRRSDEGSWLIAADLDH